MFTAYFLAFVSIFTFWLPLFFIAIPEGQLSYKLEHNVPVNLVIQTSVSNDLFTIPCSMSNSEVEELYTSIGLCFPFERSSGVCNSTFVNIYLVDINYIRDDIIYNDTQKRNEVFPIPFNKAKKEFYCSHDFLYDPTGNVFVDETATNYIAHQDYWGKLLLVCTFGSFLGGGVIASFIVVAHAVLVLFDLICLKVAQYKYKRIVISSTTE